MLKAFLVLFLVITIFCYSCYPEGKYNMPNEDLKEMIRSEYAFAEMAAQTDIKSSFLHFLSPDAVVFNPQPVNAHQLYNSREANKAKLAWYPAHARIAPSGEMGFSIGPWQLILGGEEKPKHFGHYISVWKKFEKSWRVVLDWGVSHEKLPIKIDSLTIDKVKSTQTQKQNIFNDLPETYFTQAILSKGWIPAVNQYSGASLNFFLEGALPVLKKNAAMEKLKSLEFTKKIKIDRAVFTTAKDLGYMYGLAESNDQKSVFLILWERNESGSWKIFTMAFNPISK